jgi:hypothetical protein
MSVDVAHDALESAWWLSGNVRAIIGAPARDIVNIALTSLSLNSLVHLLSSSSFTLPCSFVHRLSSASSLNKRCCTAKISERQHINHRCKYSHSFDYRSNFRTDTDAAVRSGRVPAYFAGCHPLYGSWVSSTDSSISGTQGLIMHLYSRGIAGNFMALPDKKTFPDYYEIIPEPICLNLISVSRLWYLRQQSIADKAITTSGPAQEEELLQDTGGFPEGHAPRLPKCSVL